MRILRIAGVRPLRPVELHLLTALLDGPSHGYGLVQRIDALTIGRHPVRPGDLYRVLARLERRGLLETLTREPVPELDNERRTSYVLTDRGRSVLREESRILDRVVQRVFADEAPA